MGIYKGNADVIQLNEKHKLFKPGQTVVDLVCSSWIYKIYC